MSKRIDYYEILEISRETTLDDIKKAYKKQAILWHPDKNKENQKEAEERFKLIAEAYTVLSDPKKRRNYDLYGDSEFNGGTNLNFDRHDFVKRGFGSKFGDFTYDRAEQIFRDFMKENCTQPTREHREHKEQHSKHSHKRKGESIFEEDDQFFKRDPFFGGAFKFPNLRSHDSGYDGVGSYRSFSYTIPAKLNPEGSKSVSTSTIIKNGKKIVVTQTTFTHPNGTKRTEVHERVEEGDQKIHENRYTHHHGAPQIEHGHHSNHEHNNKRSMNQV